MSNTQDPDRPYVEKIHELLGVALRAIERDDRQNGAMKELWMMGVTRSKEVVARDAGKTYKGLFAGNYLSTKPEHFIQWVDQSTGWPRDLSTFTTKAYTAAAFLAHCDNPANNRGRFLLEIESLKQARDGIADILRLANQQSEDAKYRLGPGRTVTRGGMADLTKLEFAIMSLLKGRAVVPLGELMRPAHDDAVWKERFNQNDRRKMKKIRERIYNLNTKLLEASPSVKISLDISGTDLLVTYL
jgi:hypothetical protein